MNDFLQQVLAQYLSEKIQLKSIKGVSGGCINNTYQLQTFSGESYFIKWNTDKYDYLFAAESSGLSLLDSNTDLQVPKVLVQGSLDGKSYLLLEWIEKGRQKPDFWEDFGTKLAQLHQNTSASYGLDHDNYIGKLYQSNKIHNTWYDFFREERLQPQIKLASERNLIDSKIEQKFDLLFKHLEKLVPLEPPALLHGDL